MQFFFFIYFKIATIRIKTHLSTLQPTVIHTLFVGRWKGIIFSSFVSFSFISKDSNLFPRTVQFEFFGGEFEFSEEEKSQLAKPVEFGGSLMIFICCLIKKSSIIRAQCNGALSSCQIHELLNHNSDRLGSAASLSTSKETDSIPYWLSGPVVHTQNALYLEYL